MSDRPNFNDAVRLGGSRRLYHEEDAYVCPKCGANNTNRVAHDVERIDSNRAFCRTCSHSGPIEEFLKEDH